MNWYVIEGVELTDWTLGDASPHRTGQVIGPRYHRMTQDMMLEDAEFIVKACNTYEALREVAEAARKAYNQGYDVPHFIIEALDKLDEARRG